MEYIFFYFFTVRLKKLIQFELKLTKLKQFLIFAKRYQNKQKSIILAESNSVFLFIRTYLRCVCIEYLSVPGLKLLSDFFIRIIMTCVLCILRVPDHHNIIPHPTSTKYVLLFTSALDRGVRRNVFIIIIITAGLRQRAGSVPFRRTDSVDSNSIA